MKRATVSRAGPSRKAGPEFGHLHPEPELALVIGRTASGVTAAAAMERVFGYTVHNAITAPTMRGEYSFHRARRTRHHRPIGTLASNLRMLDTQETAT